MDNGFFLTVDNRKPTEVHDSYWVYAKYPKKDTSHIVGKWLVFKDLDSLDEAWSQIRSAVLEQKLASCVEAKLPQ